MSYWKRITNLEDSEQITWFQASEVVYKSLFPASVRELWLNFKDYILDTEQRREKESGAVDPEDFYYVAVANGIVHGMASFTVNRSEKLGFVSYLGVKRRVAKNQLHTQTVTRMFREIIGEIDTQVNKADCEGFLFELETVSPEDLDIRWKARRGMTIRDRDILERIKITDAFQKLGALKLMWVTYYQPRLVWNWNLPELRMHLMFAPTGFDASRVRERITLSRDQIKRYVKFVYLTEYWEGYEVTEKDPDRKTMLRRWKGYLKELYELSVKSLPSNVTLQRIHLAVPKPPIFISYRDEDKKLAELAQEYLESLGFPVFFWGKNSRQSVGNRVWPTIYKWMDNSRFILILVTSDPLPEGQLKELEYMLEHNYFCSEDKIVLPLIVGCQIHVPRSRIPDSIIRAKCPRRHFCQEMEQIGEILNRQVSTC